MSRLEEFAITKWSQGENNNNKLANKLYRESRRIPYSFKVAICYDIEEDQISFSGCLSENERFESHDGSKVIGYLGSRRFPSDCWQYAMNLINLIVTERRVLHKLEMRL